MSLTSYRAAPPRVEDVGLGGLRAAKCYKRQRGAGAFGHLRRALDIDCDEGIFLTGPAATYSPGS
jgi:hypothetical protein